MRNSLISCLSMIFALLAAISCSDNPTESNSTLDIDAQFETTEKVLKASEDLLSVSATTFSMAQFIPGLSQAISHDLSKLGSPPDTLFPDIFTCPFVIWDVSSNILTLDYGDGCEDANGRIHSGNIEIRYNGSLQTGAILSVSFNDYTSDNKSISGNFNLSVSDSLIQTNIENVTISGPDGTFTINADLELAVGLNNPAIITDDVHFLTGSFSIVNVDTGENFALEIADPVRIEIGCPYPTSGVVNLSGDDGSGSFTASVDFFPENGDCDDIVAVTIEQTTRTISL